MQESREEKKSTQRENGWHQQALKLLKLALWAPENLQKEVYVDDSVVEELKGHGVAALIRPILPDLNMSADLRSKWEKLAPQ